jgi:uncharacterized membrane protein (Fun14 family)
MVADSLTSIFAIIGGGFFGGLLLGYAFKKVVYLIAVIVGLYNRTRIPTISTNSF